MIACHQAFSYAIGISLQIMRVCIVAEMRAFNIACWFCQFASEIWRQVKKRFDIHLDRENFRSPKQWLFDFIDRISPEQSTVLAITIWHIWEKKYSQE
jgi:hypothetical protein